MGAPSKGQGAGSGKLRSHLGEIRHARSAPRGSARPRLNASTGPSVYQNASNSLLQDPPEEAEAAL
jgi:hypothetical protein